MRRTLIGILSLLFSSFLFAVPASAVNLPACTDVNADGTNEFTLVAQDSIIFEHGPTTINGNVMVTSPNGLVRVGNNNVINGTVTAFRIEISPSAVVAHCNATIIVGVCGPNAGNPGTFAAVPGACKAFTDGLVGGTDPLPTPVIDPACVGVISPDVTVPTALHPNGSTLAPGCYRDLRLNALANLKLTAGASYNFRGIRLLHDSKLEADPAGGAAAIVNLTSLFITESGVRLTDLNVNSLFATGAVVQIFNNSILTRVVINAPFGNVHPHTGTQLLACSEIVAKTMDVQPITTDCPNREFVCTCPDGLVFADQTPGDKPQRACVLPLGAGQ